MEELTIDNTPVKNEKDQEAVIEAVLFTMGGAVELKQLAVSIGPGNPFYYRLPPAGNKTGD